MAAECKGRTAGTRIPVSRAAGAMMRRVRPMDLALLGGHHRRHHRSHLLVIHLLFHHRSHLLVIHLLFQRFYACTEEVKAQPASKVECNRLFRQHLALSSCLSMRQITCGCAIRLAARGKPPQIPTGIRQRGKFSTTQCTSRDRSMESLGTAKDLRIFSRIWRMCQQTPSAWRCSSVDTFRRRTKE